MWGIQDRILSSLWFLCCPRKNELVAESLLFETAIRQDLAVASSFLWRTWQIGTKYNQGREEKEDLFLVNFSPLVCFHQYFQFVIQKNSKTGYFFDDTTMIQTPEGSRCVHSKCGWETSSLQKAGRWQCSVTCLWERMLFHFKETMTGRTTKQLENRAIAITHFHLGFEGQWFWHA